MSDTVGGPPFPSTSVICDTAPSSVQGNEDEDEDEDEDGIVVSGIVAEGNGGDNDEVAANCFAKTRTASALLVQVVVPSTQRVPPSSN